MQGILKRWRNGFMRAICFVLVFITGMCPVLPSVTGNEYNIKAMFVLNFIKYIDWPSESATGFFRIGIAGKSDMYEALKGMTSNINSINETKQILIEEINDESKDGFKIIVISKSENNHIDEWIKRYKNKGVLLISDEYKGHSPTVINLLNLNNKIRFELDMSSAHDQGIRISSKLIELAMTVKP
jgi:hypothetical protein